MNLKTFTWSDYAILDDPYTFQYSRHILMYICKAENKNTDYVYVYIAGSGHYVICECLNIVVVDSAYQDD